MPEVALIGFVVGFMVGGLFVGGVGLIDTVSSYLKRPIYRPTHTLEQNLFATMLEK